jgi:hypothetical protein
LRALGTPEDEFGRLTFLRHMALAQMERPFRSNPILSSSTRHPRSTTPYPASCALMR